MNKNFRGLAVVYDPIKISSHNDKELQRLSVNNARKIYLSGLQKDGFCIKIFTFFYPVKACLDSSVEVKALFSKDEVIRIMSNINNIYIFDERSKEIIYELKTKYTDLCLSYPLEHLIDIIREWKENDPEDDICYLYDDLHNLVAKFFVSEIDLVADQLILDHEKRK